MNQLAPITYGLIGGMITLIVKYVVDQFAESHKLNLSIAAKSREKYQERQASIIVELNLHIVSLVGSLRPLSLLHLHDYNSKRIPVLPNLEPQLHEIEDCIDRFSKFVDSHELFIPDSIFLVLVELELNSKTYMYDCAKTIVSGHSDMDQSKVLKLKDGHRRIKILKGEFQDLARGIIRVNDKDLEPKLKGEIIALKERLATATQKMMLDPTSEEARQERNGA